VIEGIRRAVDNPGLERPTRVASAPEPRDTVHLRAPGELAAHRTRSAALWSEMQCVGLLTGAPFGLLGAALSATAKDGLLALFQALDRDGVRFYGDRGPLAPDAIVLDRPFQVAAEGQGGFPIESFKDLQALDAVHFSGDAAGTDRASDAANVVQGLHDAGYHFWHTTRNGLTWEEVDPLAIWKMAAREPGERNATRAVRIEGPNGGRLLDETDDHPEVRQMMRVLSASEKGNDPQTFYSNVAHLVENGWEIGHVDFPRRAPYCGDRGDMVLMFSPEAVNLPVPAADLGDAAKLERHVQVQVAAQAKFLKPDILGGRLGRAETNDFTEATLYACPELKTEACAEVLAGLMPLIEASPEGRVHEAARTLHEIRERVKDRARLAEVVAEATRLLQAPEFGGLDWRARQAVTLDVIAFVESDGRTDQRAAFFEVARATRDAQAAIEVFDVLRREGNFDDRMAAFRALSIDGVGVPVTARDLAAIIDTRLPDESMLDAGKRFAALHRALENHHQGSQTREITEKLSALVRDSQGRLSIEQAQATFLGTWLHKHDVAHSLSCVAQASRPAGTISDEGETVQLGSVRVQKRAS